MACGEACERLDVVDAEDSVIGVGERWEIHRKGLYHRSVHVFVIDEAGRLYLQRRSTQKEEHPGKWDSSVSGHVKSGESYMEAARRELNEEIGVTGVPERVTKIHACEETGMEHSVLYRVRQKVGDPLPIPNLDEVVEGRFLEIPEIQAWICREPDAFGPSFRLLLRRYLEATGDHEVRPGAHEE